MSNKDRVAKFSYVDIAAVKPYVRNAKKHPPEQIQRLAKQIDKFGFDQPIVVDKDMVIIKGHGRREAALSLGMKEVPVVVADHLTEDEARLARIADNKLPEYGEIDEDMLKFEFGTLAAHEDVDLTLSGFELTAIEKLMEEPVEEEKAPAPEKEEASQFIITIHCETEPQMQGLYNELSGRGLAVKMMT